MKPITTKHGSDHGWGTNCVWDASIPKGRLTLVEGDLGIGKTNILLDIAARVSSGKLPGSQSSTPQGVLIFNGDDIKESVLLPRLVAAGAYTSRVFSGESLELSRETDSIRDEICEGGIGLVIFDPLVAFLSPGFGLRRTLMSLSKLAKETGSAIVVTRYPNKGKDREREWAVAASQVVHSLKADTNDPNLIHITCAKGELSGKLEGRASFRLVSADVPLDGSGTIETVRVHWVDGAWK